MSEKYKLYSYRWVVLAVFMFINLAIQILWITYAPITGLAAEFYGVTDLQIGMLSMVFMIAFVPLSIPVSWVIDTYGFRLAVGIGAVLMGVFGLLRGFAGANYSLVLWSTVGIAAAQPFLLNAWTTIPAKWFPSESRATIVGLITLANLVGAALGMVLTPILIETMTISNVQLIYGGVAAFSSLLFLLLAREKPPTPPCPPEQETRALMLDGLKHALTIKPFWFYLVASFFGLGIFNGITTWVGGHHPAARLYARRCGYARRAVDRRWAGRRGRAAGAVRQAAKTPTLFDDRLRWLDPRTAGIDFCHLRPSAVRLGDTDGLLPGQRPTGRDAVRR